jgi:hypothetical protein
MSARSYVLKLTDSNLCRAISNVKTNGIVVLSRDDIISRLDIFNENKVIALNSGCV